MHVPGDVSDDPRRRQAAAVAVGRGRRSRARSARSAAARGTSRSRWPTTSPPPTEVDAVLEQARAAGASYVGEAAEREWGGYTGYFGDPAGFRWEIAYNPGPIGQTVLPRPEPETERGDSMADTFTRSQVLERQPDGWEVLLGAHRGALRDR